MQGGWWGRWRSSAGGVGDFLPPPFGVSCANHNTGTQTAGATTTGTGNFLFGCRKRTEQLLFTEHIFKPRR